MNNAGDSTTEYWIRYDQALGTEWRSAELGPMSEQIAHDTVSDLAEEPRSHRNIRMVRRTETVVAAAGAPGAPGVDTDRVTTFFGPTDTMRRFRRGEDITAVDLAYDTSPPVVHTLSAAELHSLRTMLVEGDA